MKGPMEGLPRLVEIADFLREKALAENATAKSHCAELQAKLDDLRQQEIDLHRRAATSGPSSTAHSWRAEALWSTYLGQERNKLLGLLARSLADLEETQAQARRAVGRSDVLQKIAERQRDAKRS